MTTIKKKKITDLLCREFSNRNNISAVLQSAARHYRQYSQKTRPIIFDYIDLPDAHRWENTKKLAEELKEIARATDRAINTSSQRDRECVHELVGPENTLSGKYRCKKCGLTVYLSVLKERQKMEDTKLMCTADEERIIRTVVVEALHRKMMFTSVDIANDIKLSGNWIRNHVVASYLRTNVLSICWDLGISYTTTLIPVTLENGDVTQAYLYHPFDTDASEYTDRHQRALDPIAANHPKSATLHIQDIPPVMSNPTIDTDTTFDITPWRVSSA